MKRSLNACLIIFMMAPLAQAQSVVPAPNDARELWRVRAQNVTNDLLKDATDLNSMKRAVLWVKLAQRWWREDPKRATTWVSSAIEVVEQVPNKETPKERQERLGTARTLLTIVTPLDQKFVKRLLAVSTGGVKSTSADGSDTAFALVEAALALVGTDPKRAAELGVMALRIGAPPNIDQLLFPLRKSDPRLADALFAQALAVAKQNNASDMFVNGLLYVAFPAQRGVTDYVGLPPESLRIEFLQIILNLFNTTPDNSKNPNYKCALAGWLSFLNDEFERLLPQQFQTLRQEMIRCRSASPLMEQRIDDNTRSQPLNTVESLLQAADDAKDIQVRTVYAHRAAALAVDHRDYELALKILEDMSKEQRDFMDESWISYRWQWAADGAIEHFKNGRYREMNLLLDGVPSDLQPLARAAFVSWLPEKVDPEIAPIIQILNDAIKGLRRSTYVKDEDKYKWYFGLLKATVKYQFTEANAVLKDAISSLNKNTNDKELDMTDYLRHLGAPLVEMDEFVVKDALASVTLPQTRAQLRLALLDATLKRLQTSSQN